jgi:hypothetical protein
VSRRRRRRADLADRAHVSKVYPVGRDLDRARRAMR